MTHKTAPLTRTPAALTRLVLVAALAIAPVGCAPGDPDRAANSAAVVADAESGLPLWRVDHAGGTAYLMGSVHLLRPEVYPLDPTFYDVFDAADAAVFELTLDDLMAAGPAMLQWGMYGPGRTLRDDLPADLHRELTERAAALGVPAQMVDGMKPWMVALTVSSLVLQAGGFEAASGIDMHFYGRAREQGIPILGLETVEDQFSTLDGLSREAQVALVRQTLEDLDDTAEELDRATELWRRGDAEALAEMLNESMADQPELSERLLFERNRRWVPRIEELMAEHETLVVIVGMGHLVGERSVVEGLEARGYAPTRVPAAAPVR